MKARTMADAPLALPSALEATARLAAQYHDIEARRAVWRAAAAERWRAAHDATDDFDRTWQARLAATYEQRAEDGVA